MALHVISQSIRLYDMEYMAGGCKGDPPLGPSFTGTTMDDTPGCYLTNYVILAVGIIGAIAMVMNKGAGPTYTAFASVFFFFTGAGYGLAGWLHQNTTSQSVNDNFEVVGLKSVSISLSNAGTLGLVLIGVQLLIKKYSISCGWVLYSIAAIVNGGAVVYEFLALPSYFTLSGAVHIVGALFVTVVYLLLCEFPKAISVLMIGLGFVVQGALASTCGPAAYPDCFKDCILPAPHFNHNAVFHTMVAVGMLTLLIFMSNSPDMSEDDEKYTSHFHEDDDE